MAAEICTATGCGAVVSAGAVGMGGFFLGSTTDVAWKIYYKSRAFFDTLPMKYYDPSTEKYKLCSMNAQRFRRLDSEIQMAGERIIKSIGVGVILGVGGYLGIRLLQG